MPHFLLSPPVGGTRANQGRDDDGLTLPLSTVDLPDQIRGIIPVRNRAQCYEVSANGTSEGVGNLDRQGLGISDANAFKASPISLASVLIVAPPIGNASCVAAARAAEDTTGVEWLVAAISAQQELGARTTTAQQRGSGTSCPTLVVLTVIPPLDAHAADMTSGIEFSGENSPGYDDTTETCAPGNEDRPWRLAVLTQPEHLELYLDHDASAAISTAAGQSIGGVAFSKLESDGEKGDLFDVASGASAVVAMRAVDGNPRRLRRAFLSAGIEGALVRPDGHIAWMARRGATVDGISQGYCLKQELVRALGAVYARGDMRRAS